MSAFDQIDKRFRQPEPIRLERTKPGDDCPSPKCSGRIIEVFTPSGVYLTCSACAWKPKSRK